MSAELSEGYSPTSLADFEQWFPEDGTTLILPDSAFAKHYSKEVTEINKLFDDLGATIYWLADTANERMDEVPSVYKKLLEELQIIGQSLHLLMQKDVDISVNEFETRYARQRGDRVTYWTAKGVSAKFEDYVMQLTVREEPFEVFGEGGIQETRDPRFSLEVLHKPSKTKLRIRIDPETKGQLCYDFDIPTLVEGLVDVHDKRQLIINGRPTHHILNPRIRMNPQEFCTTLQVLRKYIDSQVGSRSYQRAA